MNNGNGKHDAEHAGILRAIRIVGSERKLARQLGVTRAFLYRLRMKKCAVPIKRIEDFRRVTNGRVSKHALRPDLW